jgi:hypothetical protein
LAARLVLVGGEGDDGTREDAEADGCNDSYEHHKQGQWSQRDSELCFRLFHVHENDDLQVVVKGDGAVEHSDDDECDEPFLNRGTEDIKLRDESGKGWQAP